MSIHTYEWNYDEGDKGKLFANVEFEYVAECKGHGSHEDHPEYVSVIEVSVKGQSVYAMQSDKTLVYLEEKCMDHFKKESKDHRDQALIEAYIYSRGE